MSRLSFFARHRYRTGGFELNLSFETTAQVTALVGPSAAGKTTAMSILAGVIAPQQGRITLAGQTLLDTERRIAVARQRQLGVVFQDRLLFPHLSVAGNLRYGQRRRGNRVTQRADYDRVVQVLELEDVLQRRPEQISGGQQQRVALGRALLSAPRMLLLDEPVTALDEPLAGRILDYLQRVVSEWQVPVLFVSHSMTAVQKLAHWTVVIESGRCLWQGPTAEALRRTE